MIIRQRVAGYLSRNDHVVVLWEVRCATSILMIKFNHGTNPIMRVLTSV